MRRLAVGALIAVIAVEFVDELVDGVFRVTLPLIRTELDLSYGKIGLLLGVPAIVANFIEPFVFLSADRWPRRILIAGGGVAFAISLGLIAGAPGFAVLMAGFILFFPASGTFVSISQASLMDAAPHRREQNMARWTVAGYLGNLLGPLGVALSLALGGGWRGAYAAIAVITIFALVRMMKFPFVAHADPHESLRRAVADAFRQLRRKEVLRWLTMLEAMDFMLDILTAFLALYFVDVGKLSVPQVAVIFGAQSAAGLLGELGVVALLERVRGLAYLKVSAGITLVLYPFLLLVGPIWAKVAISIALSVVTAGWYSILQAQLYGTLPDRSGTALALGNVSGLVWSFVPIALGFIAERFGITTLMWVLWLGPIVLLAGIIRVPTGVALPPAPGHDQGQTMSDAELAFTPATELAELVRLKKISPVELVDLYATRIEELNPQIGAYLTLTLDQARAQAKQAESDVNGDELPPFHGVPISIKDLNNTSGVRTTHGNSAFKDNVPDFDDESVARIKRAGFIMLGKTNTPEFGTTCFTDPPGYYPARNPWDITRTTGGSSGGAAGALAAGLCPISQGSDGGGSIRIPSSLCGLFGIKASRGRVSHAPGAPSFLSQDGPLARTVADAAALLDVMAGYETGDAWYAPPPVRPFADEVGVDPGRLRVAVSVKPPLDAACKPDNAAAATKAAAQLADLGHDVDEADPPDWPQEVVEDFLVTWAVRACNYDPMPPFESLEPVNQALIEFGRTVDAVRFDLAQLRIMKASRMLVSFFEGYDVLVTPTVADQPPVIGSYRDPNEPIAELLNAASLVPFTPPWNTTGQPAVSLPLYHDRDGLPTGTQIIGRPGAEATLIRVSSQLEQALPWADRRPPVS